MKIIIKKQGDLKRYVFRASRINPKTGLKEYARDHGIKAFKIPVKDD